MKKIVFVLLCFGLAGGLFAEHETEVPKRYEEKLKGHLTPLKEVLSWEDPFSEEDEPGVTLLSETVTLVHPDGRVDLVLHSVYKALSEQGAEQLARRRFSFSGKRQKIHFLGGRTVNVDGKTVEVPKEGVFLQRASGDADAALYDDQEELVVVMPEMKAGSVIETIVLREDVQPLVEEQYSGWMNWGPGWPVVKRRRLVGVGEEMNVRLRVESVGSPVPKAREWTQDDLVWREWIVNRLGASNYEVNRPPEEQVGPATWVTTYPSWDTLGRWYGQVLSERRTVSADLQKAGDEALEGVEGKRAMLDALYTLVAKEVRYTGLEFGQAGLRPYDCGEVWKRKYGDCKDKSNLLATLLREKGIEAWVGLVNTEDAGIVHQKVPGTSHFNHAIVVANLGEGDAEELVFCDPTISYGRAGVLSPSVGARDVFVVEEDGGRFVKTPDGTAGSYHYDFDLSMDESGRLSGWMTLTATGYYVSGMSGRYDGLDRETAMSRLGGSVRAFFDGAEVVDIVLPENIAPGLETIEVRAFFTTPARESDSEGGMALPFPVSRSLLMNFGDKKEREHPYFQWRDEIEMDVKVVIPDGLVPSSLPRALNAESDPYSIDARWDFSPGEVKARMVVRCKQSLIEAGQVLVAAQAARAMNQWLEQPLLLKHGADWKPVPQANKLELPLMPTGEGQLDLVDRWYPLGNGAELRKRALKKVISLFPNDPETVFSARSDLAYLLYYVDDMEEAIEAYEGLCRRRPRGVEVETYGFAGYMWAYCLLETEKFEEAGTQFKAVADLEDVSDFRKGWAMVQRSEALLRAGKVAEAREVLTEGEAIEGEHYGQLLVVALLLELGEKDVPGAVKVWHRFHEEHGEIALDALDELAGEEREEWFAPKSDVISLLKELSGKVEGEEGERIAKLEGVLVYEVEKDGVAKRLRDELLALFEEDAPEYFGDGKCEDFDDREAFEEHLKALESESIDEWLKHARVYPDRYEAGETFTWYLWRLLYITGLKERRVDAEAEESGFLKRLITLCETIPHKDGNYWECQFIRGGELALQEKWAEAEAIYAAMLEDPDLDPDFDHAAWYRRGLALERLGRWEEALECHLSQSDELMEFESVVRHQARAGLIQARLGRPDEALQTWSELVAVPPALYENSAELDLIEEAIELSKTPEETKAFWISMAEWWDGPCREYAEELGIELSDAPVILDAARQRFLSEILGREKSADDATGLAPIFDGLVYSVRWLPSDAEMFSATFNGVLQKYSPKDPEAFIRVTVDMFGRVSAGKKLVRETSAWRHMAFRHDLGEEELHEEVKLWLEGIGDYEESVQELTVYIYGETAAKSGEDLGHAEELLRGLWKQQPAHLALGTLVNTLGKVLNAQGKEQELVVFLKEAIESPGLQGNKAVRERTEGWLRRLQKDRNESELLLTVLKRLEDMRDMTWYAHVSPQKLGEERFENEEDLWEATEGFHDLERYKWMRLLLEKGGLGSDRQQEAFFSMMDLHLDGALTNEAVSKIRDVVLEEEGLPNGISANVYWEACVDATLYQRDPERMKVLAKHSAREGLRKDLMEEGVDDYVTMSGLFETDTKECLKLAEGLVGEEELSDTEVSLLQALSLIFLERREDDAQKSLLKLLEKARFSATSGQSSRKMRLALIRQGREFSRGIHDGGLLYKEFAERLKELAAKAEPGWRVRSDFDLFPDLSSEEVNFVMADVLESDFQGNRRLEGAWIDVLDGLLIEEEALLLENLKRLLETVPELEEEEFVDRLIGGLVRIVRGRLAEREGALEQLGAWYEEQKPGVAKDYAMIVLFANQSAVVPEEELGGLLKRYSRERTSDSRMFRIYLAGLLMDRGDKKRMEKLVDDLSDGELFSEYTGPYYLRIMRWLGREEEADLLAEELADVLRDGWMTAWQSQQYGDYTIAVRMQMALGNEESERGVWLEAVPKLLTVETERKEAEAMLAMVQEDWERVAMLMKELREEDPGLTAEALGILAGIKLGREGALERGKELILEGALQNDFYFNLRDAVGEAEEGSE